MPSFFMSMPYQIQYPQPQGTSVRLTQGKGFDAAVDLRRAQHNFGKWVCVELPVENKRHVWVPPCFFHGFLVTSESTNFVDKITECW
jgi:dTDP-4-dehydrorhamnose 3,5-epimerase